MTEEQPMIPGPAFTTDGVSTGYGKHMVSNRLSLTIEHGTRTALVGPNGSGKSTTLKTLARLIAPLSGAVYLSGQNMNRLPTRQVARQMAILPQVHEGSPTPAGMFRRGGFGGHRPEHRVAHVHTPLADILR